MHVGQRVGPRHRVVHERGGEELAGVGIVDDLLHQCLAHALGHAAVDLPLERDGIDDCADVVDDRVRHQRHLAGVGIDLGLAHVAAVGPGVGGRHERARLVEPGLEALGKLAGREGGARDVLQRHRAVGAGHGELAVGELQVVLARHRVTQRHTDARVHGAVLTRRRLDGLFGLQVVGQDDAGDCALVARDAHRAVDEVARLRGHRGHVHVLVCDVLEQRHQVDFLLVVAAER